MGRHSRQAQPAAAPQPGPRGHRGHRRHHPVRTVLLASSAAMAVGAVAASTGVLSGVTGQLPYGGGDTSGGTGTQADGPVPAQTGSDIPSPLGGTTTPAPSTGPATADSPTAPAPSGTPTRAPRPTASATKAASPTATAPSPTRTSAAPTVPVRTTAPVTPYTQAPTTRPAATDDVTAARATILSLVNQQRATAGCGPLTADSALNELAQNFSEDMAARGFFDHTDPDGNTPWDRAKKLGITGLGGENIARGQADAQAVMDAWMNSPGHRANILNCDFKTLGVGVHFGAGGPWWTQDFGY
ncbi:CAP domain-containing protein [Actinacidiphila acididurans]|uniref:CAP domain-containing protein n=1 Tax=Actinacidiphila acididurans TaxID=2784346 RepID=A0ABS2TKN9_9ACTN|nr:CAP domain-containing protein [Actinacidiphila acididurans]MBM9503901.1 CAP domain-containing protein [Actinacidiphila acididurans]